MDGSVCLLVDLIDVSKERVTNGLDDDYFSDVDDSYVGSL